MVCSLEINLSETHLCFHHANIYTMYALRPITHNIKPFYQLLYRIIELKQELKIISTYYVVHIYFVKFQQTIHFYFMVI